MSTPFLGQLEPPALVDAFLARPPDGFAAARLADGTPTFTAPFDLLTTADEGLRARISALPGYAGWRRLLNWRTRFVGTTVSEYAWFAGDLDPATFADRLVRDHGSEHRLLIVKDIPEQSPLLPAADNARADALVAALRARGFVVLEGQALAWVPITFRDEDDYLGRLSRSRRKDIRRKLRARAALEIETVPTGDARFGDARTLERLYALYEQVYAQSEIHFDRLNADFFRAVFQDAAHSGVVFIYRHGGEMIGWNLCFPWRGKLVDKYIGLSYPAAREQNLYFVSWMKNLEYARTRGLTHYVAGWTDPQVKAALGASFTFTRHAVYARNGMLRAILKHLARHFESDRQVLQTIGPRHGGAADG